MNLYANLDNMSFTCQLNCIRCSAALARLFAHVGVCPTRLRHVMPNPRRHVEQFYTEANASFKAAKKCDNKLIKFLEKVSHGDPIPTEVVEETAALADELKDDVATVRDNLSMMATIASRMAKKRDRSAATDTEGEA